VTADKALNTLLISGPFKTYTEEFDFVLDPQPDLGLVDGATERQWDIQWADADAEELDPYERDSDDLMDEEPELPVMGYFRLQVCN